MAVVMIIVFSKVVKKDDDELTNAKNGTVNPNKGITPEMRKAIVREEIKSREDDPKEKEDDTDEWDESHALDMVLNDMVEDLEEEDYDVDVEVEHNDELTEPTKESKVYIKSIEKVLQHLKNWMIKKVR